MRFIVVIVTCVMAGQLRVAACNGCKLFTAVHCGALVPIIIIISGM